MNGVETTRARKGCSKFQLIGKKSSPMIRERVFWEKYEPYVILWTSHCKKGSEKFVSYVVTEHSLQNSTLFMFFAPKIETKGCLEGKNICLMFAEHLTQIYLQLSVWLPRFGRAPMAYMGNWGFSKVFLHHLLNARCLVVGCRILSNSTALCLLRAFAP